MKPVKLTVLIATVFCLVAAISCQHQDEKSGDPVFVKLTIQLDSQKTQSGADYILSSGTSSAMILAVPASISTVTTATDLSAAYDKQMLVMADNTVTLTVPLETSMRLVKLAFQDELTRATILATNPTPLFMGLSSPFTVTAATTTKSVEVVMQEVVVVASTVPADAATDVAVGTTVAVTFNHAMDTATLTTNTADTTCSGSLQLSADSFSTCIQMASAPAASNSNKTFTITPASSLASSTAHQIKVTTSAQSANSTALEAVTTTGFTTAVVTSTLIGGTVQGNDLSANTVVTFFSGSGAFGPVADGVGLAAVMYAPYGLTNGTDLYYTETFLPNHVIRHVVIGAGATSGQVTTVAGSGAAGTGNPVSDDGTGLAAEFNTPSAITTDGANLLWVADTNSNLIRQIDISNSYEVTTLAGGLLTGGDETACPGTVSGNCFDGTGQYARFDFPYGITYHNGYLYVADRDNCRIRRINVSTAYVETWSGEGTCGFAEGLATTVAQFNWPTSITTDGSLYLFVADMNNHRLRRVGLTTGFVDTIAGDGTTSVINSPRGVTTDGTNVFISETVGPPTRIRYVGVNGTPGSEITLAGDLATNGCTQGTGVAAQFNTPKGIVSDGTYLYVAVQSCAQIFRLEAP